ncbi:MAG TPA: AIR synthase-related protein, partial [Spirochaetia bacterium]|nr:AIR synthase-related protein [Spirochaetia bacterium]
RRFLRSVFHDNSGVITFDRSTLVCFKAETHNSPSALDPYGGAITGIVGVNRDIMGTGLGAKPIFNTNVLCFASPDTPVEQVPPGLLHPRRVLEGVHQGIVDGGNQSGIPVAAGAFLFDESYLGKPLVFCGTGGMLPARIRGRDACEKQVKPGDLAVMTGGRIGKDGIHGATFSSEALSESSPTSAVQIGDPITQKKMLDFLLEARDQGLYRGLTDNGAGGLSSSLGEMAGLSGGVSIDLDACPLKYAGLAPWEILVSESQERMSLAVPPASIEGLLALARRRGVEAAVVGSFTDSGRVEVTAGGRMVARVGLDFLHGGLPVMDLPARWRPPAAAPRAAGALYADPALGLQGAGLPGMMRDLVSDPNVRSREEWVRCYDHEVQARSVVKPFVGRRRDGPSDGAVFLVRHDSRRGITITHGICPRYGDHDTYDMAQCAVDEAVRAHVALGGDPRRMAALDNFCWPDPVESPDNPDGAFKMAQLVRACRGLADACMAFGLPLISGKDSMKNDARVGGRRISIRPTLLVSLMGIIPDVRRSQTTDFKQPGDLIYVVGETRGELGGTCVERRLGTRLGACPSVRAAEAWRSYVRLHAAIRGGLVRSCHDLSDAGLWGALAESCLGGDLGAAISLDPLPTSAGLPRDPALLLFCETPSRFLVSVASGKRRAWERRMKAVPLALVGRVTKETRIQVEAGAVPVAGLTLEEVRAAWNSQRAEGGPA